MINTVNVSLYCQIFIINLHCLDFFFSQNYTQTLIQKKNMYSDLSFYKNKIDFIIIFVISLF